MAGYEDFARNYDFLISDFDYEGLFNYYLGLLREHGIKGGALLDLACGTGTLAISFAAAGYEVIGSDASCDMLCEAQSKVISSGENVLLICQDMRETELAGEIDACVCALDGINHLTAEDDVKRTFERVAMYMKKGGVFVFDVNTPYKHRHVLANNTFVYDVDEAYCVWLNSLDEETDTVEITLDIFEHDEDDVYVRVGESFCERAYSVESLISMLNSAGFEVSGVYDWLTRDAVRSDGEKAVFVCVKC